MNKLTQVGHIVKVDLANRTVSGVAMDETPDRDGEIYDYDSSKQYVQRWADTQAENTKAAGQDVSYGNLRAQHDAKIAAGKVAALTFDDQAKAVPIVAKVVDDAEWEKCLAGVYTGFSVKGRQIGKKWRDGNFQRYTVDPIEISLVDLPCNPGATFTVVKADGATEEREFASVDDPAETLDQIAKRNFSERRRKELASSGKALPDGSFPIENRSDLENAIRAIGRAKDPDAARSHIRARAKDLGAEDLLPDDWKEKAASAADLQKLLEDGAELLKRLTPATVKENKMEDETQKSAEEISKAAAIEKLKAAHKAHSEVGACLSGYCDHGGDVDKCMEKVADAHKTIKAAFKDDDDADDKAKSAKEAEIAKAVDPAKTPDVAELVKAAVEAAIAPLNAEIEKLKNPPTPAVERQKPHLAGRVVSKSAENTDDKDVKKFAEIKKDDPEVVRKAAEAVYSAEPVLID